MIIAIFYLKKRQRAIDELTSYIGTIESGNYSLDFQDNTEDELSNLKNELYKISVSNKERAEEAVNNRKALADSVSDISHQIKTPLTSVSILVDNMVSCKDMPEDKRRQFLMEMERQITKINWFAATMLKLSRLDAGVVEFEKGTIKLDKMISEIAENLSIIAEVKNVTIKTDIAKDIALTGDYNWNLEAVSNIVKNAIEHSYNDKEIVVRASDNSVYTSIEIINYGNTISNEDIRHIFDGFYRAAGADKDSNGIGLSLSKTIVEKQNGYISVESKDNITKFIIKYIK